MTKTYKNRLRKVCKVLFPRYKSMSIAKTVTFKSSKWWIISLFLPKWRVSFTELINYQIPKQLADFKYGNETFVSVIQEDLVKCDLAKVNKVDYFLNEITAIKCSDIYKKFNISPHSINLNPVVDGEIELFNDMMEHFNSPKKSLRRSFYVSREAMFYTFLLLIVAYSILIKIPFK